MRGLISVVVITYSDRRMRDLQELFETISEQWYANIEVVVVVERNARLFKMVSDQACKYPKVVRLSNEVLGVSRARNLAASLARGDVIAFVDDDALLPPNWADCLAGTFERHPEVIGVTGRAVPLWVSGDPGYFPKSLCWMIGATDWKERGGEYLTYFATGTNMAFRREAFDTHSFALDIDNSRGRTRVFAGLPNDENDFALRVTSDTGRPIVYNPGVWVRHKVSNERIHPRFVARYAFWQGLAESRYRSRTQWTSSRSTVYGNVLRSVGSDISNSRGGIRAWVPRTSLVILALILGGFGYLASRSDLIKRITTSLLY